MLKNFFLFLFFVCSLNCFAQRNFLGQTRNFVFNKYHQDPEFIVKEDTVNQTTLIITCKTTAPYPYYTYEINLVEDVCVSCAMISKDRKIYQYMLNVLYDLGEIVQKDAKNSNIIFKMKSADNKTFFYHINQPYINSELISRRGIFYIMITQ